MFAERTSPLLYFWHVSTIKFNLSVLKTTSLSYHFVKSSEKRNFVNFFLENYGFQRVDSIIYVEQGLEKSVPTNNYASSL